MKKFKLTPIIAGDKKESVTVKGFVEAEAKAEALLTEYGEGYCDAYVACIEEDAYEDYDHLAMVKDCDGEVFWNMAIVGQYSAIRCFRPLEEEEEEELEELRNEKEIHLSDLSREELEGLVSEISCGSMYYSDYRNSYGVDEVEVMDVCETYLMYEDEYDSLVDYIWEVCL